MAASNEFLPFAIDPSANVDTQAQYVTDATYVAGFQTGLVPSRVFNKALRQASFVASCLAQYMANTLGATVLDNGSVSNLLTQIAAVFGNLPGTTVHGVPYQTAAGVTGYSAAPTAVGQALIWDGTHWAPGNGNGDVVHWDSAGVSGANAAGTGWLVGGNGINKQWVNLSVTAAGDGPNIVVTYPNATLFGTSAYVKSVVIIDPSRAGGAGPGDSLLFGVVSQSLTGCVLYAGENGGGTRNITVEVTVEGTA